MDQFNQIKIVGSFFGGGGGGGRLWGWGRGAESIRRYSIRGSPLLNG